MCQYSFKGRDIFIQREHLDGTRAQCAELRPPPPRGVYRFLISRHQPFCYLSSKLHWFCHFRKYPNAPETDMPGFSLRQAPAAPPPPDVPQNLVGPPSQANMPRIFTYVTLPPMILFLALRMYARLFVTRKVWLDDCELSETSLVNECPLTCFPRPLPARLS